MLRRSAVERIWHNPARRRRALVVGCGAPLAAMANRLTDDYRHGYRVTATVRLQDSGALPDFIGRYNQDPFDEVLAVADGCSSAQLVAVHDAVAALDLPCRLIPGDYEMLLARAPLRELGDLPLLELAGAARPSRETVKRVTDLGVALPLAVLTLPLLAVLTLAVRLTSSGPAFFNRTRVGRHGREFVMYKLRTMHWRPGAALDLTVDAGDPRITPLGRWLRRWSLDELPQLWNVVRGDMALVGPRPEIPSVVRDWHAWQREALEVPPGLTGLAQVSGRDLLSIPAKSRLDVFYRRHHTLALDAKIMLKTVWVVLSGEGVN
ncbi:MAG TPA: sugar transferase [bacterium]|nr:sugar transferase [bacterium]